MRNHLKAEKDNTVKGKLQEQLKKLKTGKVNALEVANAVFAILSDPVSSVAEKIPVVPSKAKELAITSYQLTAGTLATVQLIAPTVQVSSTATAILSPSSAVMNAAGLGALCPLTMVLAPLCGITSVALMAGKNMSLKDVNQKAKRGEGGQYLCTCQQCLKALEFIIDRSDGLACRIAIAASVVGALPVALYTVGRKVKNKLKGTESEKHKAADSLWRAAQTTGSYSLLLSNQGLEPKITIDKTGCPLATIILATLFGESVSGTIFPKTIAALDGVSKIKSEIS